MCSFYCHSCNLGLSSTYKYHSFVQCESCVRNDHILQILKGIESTYFKTHDTSIVYRKSLFISLGEKISYKHSVKAYPDLILWYVYKVP